ncbi:MAG: DUF5069 domain-containing protein [Verrucomicrobiales bacterium]
MIVQNSRSPYEEVGGIVYFGRMLDRIRLYQSNRLPHEYHEMYGGGFDERTCDFLGVTFDALSGQVSDGGSDDELLEWCFSTGRRPTEDDIEIWNGFMSKRGWRDPMAEMIRDELESKGWSDRKDIKTLFDFFDADEERPLRFTE